MATEILAGDPNDKFWDDLEKSDCGHCTTCSCQDTTPLVVLPQSGEQLDLDFDQPESGGTCVNFLRESVSELTQTINRLRRSIDDEYHRQLDGLNPLYARLEELRNRSSKPNS